MAKSREERKKRKVKKTIIFIVFLSIISAITVFNGVQFASIYKKNRVLLKEKTSIKKEYISLKEKNDKITIEMNEIKDTDNKIKKTKENVFKYAKELEQDIKNGKSNSKIAYLTFDDGPYYLTNDVLKLLKEKKVKATFFTIGANKEKCYDNQAVSCLGTYKKIVDSGHTIANHTYSHAIFYGLYNSTDSFVKEIEKQEKNIKDKTGVTTNIFRFPGGSATAGNLKNGIMSKLRKKGYGWVDWTAQDGDGGELSSTEEAWSIFTSSIDDNIEVVLFHDYNLITYSILPDAIDYLEKNNYIILPLFYDSVMINK